MKSRFFLLVAMMLVIKGGAQVYEGTKTSWCGFNRYDFTFEQFKCIVVAPQAVAAGRPWVWNAMFFGHKTNVDSAMLAKGYHVVYIGAVDLFGSPDAVAVWNRFYEHLVAKYSLNRKPVLEALSRGGLYAFNWAAANPQKVSGIYADAPVCDIKSWPGGYGTGKGDSTEWSKCLRAYRFQTLLEAFNYRRNPIDQLPMLKKQNIPLLFVTGDADDIVPATENCLEMERRYKAIGGQVHVIVKKGVSHKHGLADAGPITDFLETSFRKMR